MKFRSRISYKSGVFPIPIYTKPHPCGGNCIFCPNVPGLPKSYVKNEDTLFALKHHFSPKKQFYRFIHRLPDKLKNKSLPIEIIILGGSFSALDKKYREDFCYKLYSAMSNCGNITYDQFHWEHGLYRPSVVTIEARPDQITLAECSFLRKIGVSKVELGVQHTSDQILYMNNRGHTQHDIKTATRILKDEGFKVGYHIMIGLPYATIDDDEKMLVEDLWQPDYSPDYLKIYPCVLLKRFEYQPILSELYQTGQWQPLDENKLLFLLKAFNANIPNFVRISRIQRQFSNKHIVAGINSGFRNRLHFKFNDIRAREVGLIAPLKNLDSLLPISIHIAEKSNDVFIEFVCNDFLLLALARIRIKDKRKILIREIKVFGEATPLGNKGKIQGRGIGSKLLKIIESYSLERKISEIFVNASFGARPFFKKRGYQETATGLLKKEIQLPP